MVVITLKFVRIRHGITMERLAELSGVSKSYISEIENGKKMPTIEVICKLSIALGVLPEELYICEDCRKKKE